MANAINRNPRNDKSGPTIILRVLKISGLNPSASVLPPPLMKRYPKRIRIMHPPINQKLRDEKGFSLSVVFRRLSGSGLVSCLTFSATSEWLLGYRF